MRLKGWMARGGLSVLMTIAACAAGALSVRFSQISWQDNNGGYIAKYSDWGSVKLEFDPSDLAYMTYEGGQYTGFINVVVSPENQYGGGWVVRNLPVTFFDDADVIGSLPEAVDIPLPVPLGMFVKSVKAEVVLSPEPLDDGPADNLVPVDVEQEDWLFGGMTPEGFSTLLGNSGNMRRMPPTPRPIPRPVPYNVNFKVKFPEYKLGEKSEIKIAEKDVIGVDEGKCGCSPGSMARSFKYLAISKQITLDDDIQDIYKALVAFCKTKIGDKGGTPWANIAKGAKDYVADKKLPIDVTVITDPAAAAKALKAGSDVTMHFSINNGPFVAMAHSVFVSSIQPVIAKIDNNEQVIAYKIKWLDDRKQGDDKVANDASILFVDIRGNVFVLDAKTNTPITRGLLTVGGFVVKTKK